jgi:catalase
MVGNNTPVFFIRDPLKFPDFIHTQKRLELRQCAIFYKADTDYGTRVAEGLKLDVKEIESLASMSQDERVKATLTEAVTA